MRGDLAVTLMVLALPTLAAPAFASGPEFPGTFESRLARADYLAEEGRWAEAVVVTAALAADFPEDPVALLRHAWALFQTGRYAEARDFYARTRDLSPGHLDAALGLGWCAQRLGDRGEARDRFREVLRADPDNASAREGLALVGRGWGVTPGAWAVGEAYAGHPARRFAAGAVAAVDATFADDGVLGASYRFLNIVGRGGRGASQPRVDLQHHEAWVVAGWDGPRWGVRVHGAWAHYSQSRTFPGVPVWSPDMGVLAASGRVTAWAVFEASVAHSFYDDFGVTQGTVRAWFPATDWLAVHAGAEVQVADGSVYPSGTAGLRFHGARWRVDLGGRYGPRRRPVDLDERSVYNFEEERLAFGAHAGATFPIAGPVSGHVSYDLEGLEAPGGPGGAPEAFSATGHRGVIGVSVGF